MDINNNETTINLSSSGFYCPFEKGGSSVDLIIGLITVVVSLPTVLLNAFIILAVTKRKDLQKPSNILLSSMAITDLLIGVIVMPISAASDFLILRQASYEYICMLNAVNMFFGPLLSTATFHHLTIIAWERYVAVQKWMDYRRIITNGRLKKIAIGTWLSVILPTVAYYTIAVVVVDRRISNAVLTGWIAVETACLFLVAYFYQKVYFGIRNRKLNEISQINVLIKDKLESKVAKTTGLLTTAFISSFMPLFVLVILRNPVPVFRTNAAFQFTQVFTQMNSLFNPLLYCYRDQRFRNAIRELLGLKKLQARQSAIDTAQIFRRKFSIRSLELPDVGKRTQRLTRSISCNIGDAFDSSFDPSLVMLKKSLSAPTLQRTLSIMETSATIHVEGGV